MSFINFNGKLLPAGTAIINADNRGLRYGDGLFETIKFRNGMLQLLDAHLDRLWLGLKAFGFELPALFTKEMMKAEIEKLLRKNQHTHARVRLTVIRGNGGLYDPENQHPNFVVQSWEIEKNLGQFNSNGLQICLFEGAFKSCDSFSHLKHNNFLPYAAAALFARQQRCNDALVINQYKRICESSLANIFLVHENIIYTPPLSEGCIAGCVRELILNNLPAKGFTIKETSITNELKMAADEIFLSNSMHPLRWVKALDEKTFHNRISLDIYRKMQQTFPDIFC